MRSTRRAILLILMLGLLMALAPAAPADAQEGGWGVEPSGPDGPGSRPYFTYHLAPGERIMDTVAISNLTDEEIVFNIYAKDAYNTPRDAAFALLADEEASVDVGSWVTLGTDTYTLAPQTRVDIPFELVVPENAEPGDHAGGIIAANAAPVEALEDEGLNVNIRHRIGSRIYVRVAGPLEPRLQVSRIDVGTSMPIVPWVTGRGDAAITYEITNVGNLRLQGIADVKVTGLVGRTVKSFSPQELPELLPGASVELTHSWSGLPPIEPLNAVVSVTYEGTDGMDSETIREVRTKRFFVWSWAAIAVIAAIVLALGLRWWRRRRARRVEAGPGDPLTSPAGARATPASGATESTPVEPSIGAPQDPATASKVVEPEPAPRQPAPVGADSGPWRS